ncbi:hypothetical protein SDC9_146019 [bioreactor metagenome]|uniref:Uncharacterized protein n=1 Tax=bioreactor metagenome TaxID=1076179 RepID=A0A645EBY0_9ZZZZ
MVELFPIPPLFLRHTVGKQAARNGFKRVGNPCRVLLRNLVVRMQAELDILLPERNRLAEHRVQRGSAGKRARSARQFLAVARAGIGENIPHDAPRVPPHVAVVMHEQFV